MAIVKGLMLLAPVGAFGLWVSGALGASYARDVDRSPAQVAEAISDLDITQQPGSPGTDPSRSGGIASVIRLERAADSVSWVVMSGEQVATRMTAHLQPLDEGARTRVTLSVERGDAPDDFVAPAFRSTGITRGLFAMALEDELNRMVQPVQLGAAECERIFQELTGGGIPSPEQLAQMREERSISSGVRDIVRLTAIEGEMRRRGCDTSNRGGFRRVEQRMTQAPQGSGGQWGQTHGVAPRTGPASEAAQMRRRLEAQHGPDARRMQQMSR